ncbi:MAG: type IVB secretion system protein IcmQ [Gammaproteobacteria bacterium]
MSNNKERQEQLLNLVKAAVQKDKELRESHQIGDRFRFVRDRLQALETHVEEQLSYLRKADEKIVSEQAEDETIVYVYLFNTQGIILQTWQRMLTPSVFYEHSVNRPIYADKSQVEAFIRSKANKTQHAYLAIHLKKTDILPSLGVKDSIGGDLVKVKEGSLKPNRLVAFVYGDHDYVLGASGEIIKKV